MKVALVVICIGILPSAWKCEETLINARSDTKPRTQGLTLYNVGKFRKFKKASENDLAPKKSNILGLYSAFGSDPLVAANPVQKPRVKKVLTFYTEPAVRSKRAVKNAKVLKIKARNKKGAVHRSKPEHKKGLRTNQNKHKAHQLYRARGKPSKKGRSKHRLKNYVKRTSNKSTKGKLSNIINKLQRGRKGKTYKAAAQRQRTAGKKANQKYKKHIINKGKK